MGQGRKTMSERVTNVEIEDVLTSIRKLVADGEWIRQRAAEANAAKDVEHTVGMPEAVDDAGKFVLTPALRVIESRAEVRGKSEPLLRFRRTAEPEVMNNEVLWTPVAPEAETAAEEPVEGPEDLKAKEGANEDALADTTADAMADEATDEAQAEPESISDILDMFDGDEDQGDEETLAADETEQGSYQSLGAAIAELEAAVGSEAGDWEPDGSETVLNDFTTPLRAVGGMDMPDIVDDEDGIEEPQPEISHSALAIREEDEASIEMPAIEAPETAVPLDLAFFARPRASFAEPSRDSALADVAIDDDDGEESALSFSHTKAEGAVGDGAFDEAEAEDFSALDAMADEPETAFDDASLEAHRPEVAMVTAEAMIDQISEAISETLADDTASAIGDELDEDLAAYLSEETALDEDMLRDLVTQVVRSELEGELGERMTRNIRKLVRREVFSILESRDAE
jgi:hypothetical protein